MDFKDIGSEVEKLITASANNREGDLHLSDGHVCEKCKNRGVFYENKMTDLGYLALHVVHCDCMNRRSIIRKAQNSGLGKVLQIYTFEKYIATEPWQRKIKEKAIQFTEDSEHKWFAICGMSGAGKTHICTAIADFYINQVTACTICFGVTKLTR